MNPYTRSQLRHRRGRALAVVTAVALGASLFVALSALGSGFRVAARAPLAELAADLVVTRPAGAGDTGTTPDGQATRGVRMPFGLSTFNAGDLDDVRGVPGVAQTAAALQLWDFGPRSTVTLAGVDAGNRAVGPGRLLAENVIKGRGFAAGEHGVAVVDRHYAAFYGIDVGQTVTLAGKPVAVVGVVELTDASQAAASNVYVPLADAQRLAGLPPDQVNQIHVQVANAADADAVAARINDTLGQVSVITADSLVQIMGAVGRVSARFSTVASAVAVLGGLVLSWLALQGLVSERVAEIGLLKALGWRRRDVVRAFVTEAAVLSAVGAVAGLVLGLVMAALLSRMPLPDISLSSGFSVADHGHGAVTGDASTRLPVGTDPLSLVLAFLVAAGGGTVAGWLTARRVAAIKPAQSLTAP